MHRTKRAEHADHAEYNEIVVALAPYLQGLPHSVAAFFFTEWASEEQRAYVQTARADFLRKYPAARIPPLLMYDPNGKAGGTKSAPFVPGE